MSDAPPPAAPATSPAPATPPAAWHSAADAEARGWAQNKGFLDDKPEITLNKLVAGYKGAESKLGVPADQLIRMPQPSAQPADLDAFWQRLGAAKEAKDIDLSGVKDVDGKAIDQALSEAIAGAAIAARAPKDAAVAIAGAVQKYFDGVVATQKVEMTTKVDAEWQKLEASWGKRDTPGFRDKVREVDDFLAQVGPKANMSVQDVKDAVDGLSKSGGIGAAKAWELMLTIARATRGGRTEHPFVGSGGNPGDPSRMTVEQAKARMTELKGDKAWVERHKNGGAAERSEFKRLNEAIAGTSSYAA